MAMTAIENQAAVFLKTLFGEIESGFLTISEFKDDTTKWFDIHEINQAADYSMELAKDRDVYFAMNQEQN